MVKKGFLFTVEGIIAALIISMAGIYVYRSFLSVSLSENENLKSFGDSILRTLNKEGKLSDYIKTGNYSGLDQEIQDNLEENIEFGLNLFQYQIVTITTTSSRKNWPVEISLNFPKNANKEFIEVFDSDMDIVPSQIDWNWKRIPITLENGNQSRNNFPIKISLNFTGSKMDNLSILPDKESIRFFTKEGEEISSEVKNWDCNEMNCSGNVVFLTSLEKNEDKKIYVYYSVGTLKRKKEYTGFPEFHIVNESNSGTYFIKQDNSIWEIESYKGTQNSTQHYSSPSSELLGNYTTIHLYEETDTGKVSLIFLDDGEGGENCNWTDSRVEMNLTEYPTGSNITLSDDTCTRSRNEFDLDYLGFPTGSWGGTEKDGGVLKLPNSWTSVETDPISATNNNLSWYSSKERIDLETGKEIKIYGLAPNKTVGKVEEAPRADLTFFTDLENSSLYYIRFSVGTSKLNWETKEPRTSLIYSNETNTVENNKLKLNWSEKNGSTLKEVQYKDWNDSNLVGEDAFDLPLIDDKTFSPSEELTPFFANGNFSIIYGGPLRIIAYSQSKKFRSEEGEEKNITRRQYYKIFSNKSFLETSTTYDFLNDVIFKWGDYYPTSQRLNSNYLDYVAYVNENGDVDVTNLPSGRVVVNSTGTWIDEWDSSEDFGIAQIIEENNYTGIRYGKNEVVQGQFKRHGEDGEIKNGSTEEFRYWWYFHLGNYTEGNVSNLSRKLQNNPNISFKYDIPDGTNMTETVLPESKSTSVSSFLIAENNTLTKINLVLWYKL